MRLIGDQTRVGVHLQRPDPRLGFPEGCQEIAFPVIADILLRRNLAQ